MNHRWPIALATPLLLFAINLPGAAAQMPGEEEADVLVQRGALEALDEMAAALRNLRQFTVTATTRTDDILDHGQLIEIAGTTTIEARMPDRLRVTVTNDKQDRVYVYDGKTVAQYAPALDLYSTFEAPDTIAKMIVAAEKQHGVELPLADLFFWAAGDAAPVNVELAYFAGDTNILGGVCGHYAYRVPGADVQLWIRKEGERLPCRIVIINTSEPTRPQYGATLTWDTNATLGNGLFAFAPPPGVTEVVQQPVAAPQ